MGDPHQSINLLAAHSGGAGSMALQMSMNKAEKKAKDDHNYSMNAIERAAIPSDVEVKVFQEDSLMIPPTSKGMRKGFSLFSCCRLFC